MLILIKMIFEGFLADSFFAYSSTVSPGLHSSTSNLSQKWLKPSASIIPYAEFSSNLRTQSALHPHTTLKASREATA